MYCVICDVSERETLKGFCIWGGFSLCNTCFGHFMKRREATRHRAEPDFAIIDWGRANLRGFLKVKEADSEDT